LILSAEGKKKTDKHGLAIQYTPEGRVIIEQGKVEEDHRYISPMRKGVLREPMGLG